jgi:hypothetical protein
MSWSYSGDPSHSELDAVRFLLGDTNFSAQQLSDEEVLYLIANRDDLYLAGADAAASLATRYLRLVDKSVGDLSISYSQQQTSYLDLEKRLRGLSLMGGDFQPYAGGISRSDKAGVSRNTDRNATGFKLGMHDYPGSEPNDR